MALSPLQLSTTTHNSLLNQKRLPSLSWKSTTRIPVQKYKRRSTTTSPIHCSKSVGTSTDDVPATKIRPSAEDIHIKKSDFPPDFMFGAGTSAYQVEGAWDKDGKGPSIWDTFTSNNLDLIKDKTDGRIAIDSYYKYKEDIQKMVEIGLDSYRFSISWPRILPDGEGIPNQKAIDHYNNLINDLLANGIKPFVTLFHWDLPQALEDKYGGFRNSQIINDFKHYVDICYKYFGDRVKHWCTLNEPWVFALSGYEMKRYPDGKYVEYTVAHNLILAHTVAAKLYKDNFQATQGGVVGITCNCAFFEPYSNSAIDKKAADRAMDFMLGWFLEPLVFGYYPPSMKAILLDILPEFTDEQREMMKQSYDFIGINYYFSEFIEGKAILWNRSTATSTDNWYTQESVVESDKNADGEFAGVQIGSNALANPEGIRKLLTKVKDKYGDFNYYVTENGTNEPNDPTKPVKEAVKDDNRRDFIANHLDQLLKAIKQDKVKVKGYFYWSLADSFEWLSGYTIRFGLIYIDYTDDYKRIKKNSVDWFNKFLKH